ncbi:VanW family protein [Thermoclostridium stercorarium subsp. stercorarium DSM 8532]|jgi:vancomycin resistance protein YoaR|uniref:VanW family protein n=2 Tax=Thermoclostridium stercorarium TaxID=1510 RepID=L7VNS6_THES1|nr:VanW family protein [Thermoclostridium stercorarium subsp. stercorarium DSM 8532]AGI39353.1 hypothetical protein Clst_1292 [Thermoclostridium stercorarium subsp. stercorarium DSM 8532]ANW98674.1 hypothetical protein CSTERTH_06340 [Thermoclostridium stercorarium subsp. thermolacticum DSM 2910]
MVKRAVKILILPLFLLFLFFLSCFLYIRHILNLTTIYPNIYIDGIYVGGLRREEAIALLDGNLDRTYQSEYLTLTISERRYKLYFEDIDYVPDYEKAVAVAFETGRRGNVAERLKEIWKTRKKALFITPPMYYNAEKVLKILDGIHKETYTEPQNAKINIFNGKVDLLPHKTGFSININESLKRIDNSLTNRVWEDVELCFEETLPSITTEMVENITYKLGEFETVFNPGNEARAHNIITACSKINQKLLLPGEEFSLDKALGDRTEKNGYRIAKVIVNNEYVDGLGGGICQVASTMYNSVLLSGLEVLERRNHSIPPSYIEMGRDATISHGYIDFRFRNNTDYAILIEAKTAGNRVIITIWGREPEVKTTARIRTQIVEVIEPEGIEEETDSSLKAGETRIVREAKPGYKVEVYRDFLDTSGTVVKTEKISVDTYLPQKKKVKKGIKR